MTEAADTVDCPTCDRSFGTRNAMANHHGKMHPDAWQDRFWSYVDRGGPEEHWWWTAATNSDGYGSMTVDGEACRAPRLAWEAWYGEPPEQQINHHCDKRLCVNPAHLYEGTQQDNVNDMWGRGRAASKLTEDEVVDIRERHRDGETLAALAAGYGVHLSAVGATVLGDNWPDAPGPIKGEDYGSVGNSGEANPHATLTEPEVVEIRWRAALWDESEPTLAAAFGVTRGNVGYIVRGDTWPDAGGPIRGEDYDYAR